ncbi:MAG: flagellin [SAR324 cluster bacterium]|nr:flagellin [SAR324 cluster bacterium]
MSLRINHNTPAMNAHRNLLQNDGAMNKTLEKLSSGLKVNRAADGPATLVISEQMRAQVAGLSQAIDNSETAVSMIQTTEANLAEVNKLLIGIRQLAIHAANEGVNDENMLQADQSEIANALATIDRISTQAQFGEKKLLDGTNGASGSTTGIGLQFLDASLKTKDSRETGFEVSITQNATKSSVRGTAALTDEIVQGGETLTVIEDGKTATYTTTTDDSVETAYKNFATEIKNNGLDIDLKLSDSGTFEATHKEYGSSQSFQVLSSTAGILSAGAGAIASAVKGSDVKGTINGESAQGQGQILTGTGPSVADLSVRYTDPTGEDIPDGGKTVGSVYVSQNSLKFQVGANHGQTVGMNIRDISTRILGKGTENESNFSALSDVDVTSFQGSQDTLAIVDKAINEVTSTRGELGAFQKNTLESNLQNLRVASENLVSSESVLRDVDMAAEMANYTRNQIMSESATAMLAQANQTPKSVLRLLG